MDSLPVHAAPIGTCCLAGNPAAEQCQECLSCPGLAIGPSWVRKSPRAIPVIAGELGGAVKTILGGRSRYIISVFYKGNVAKERHSGAERHTMGSMVIL